MYLTGGQNDFIGMMRLNSGDDQVMHGVSLQFIERIEAKVQKYISKSE
jgi:hypothetical protein